ncbi:MAG: hypothetical protein ACRELY_08330 [Polyangiaceae bacterium]
MRNIFLLGSLLVVSVGVAATSIGCGGKIAQDPESDAGSTTATTLSSAWPPCPSDSAPMPLPSDVDPEVLDACTKLCNRNFACQQCSYPSCLPTCVLDATRADCGDVSLAEAECMVDHQDESACGAPPSCNEAYCKYAQCNASPSPASQCP